VIEFLRKAARDPAVLAIKICLYRVGRNSPVVETLLEAQEEDKQVAALVELKARFDEESNIEWARALERSGVHVVYGLVGLKAHGKVALVVRREQDRIARYVHISTGNYNAVTAHLYTDIGIFTADEDIADDATICSTILRGTLISRTIRSCWWRRSTCGSAGSPDRARDQACQGRAQGPPHLQGELSGRSADHPVVIQSFARGVRIQLLVRGICCLRPGVPGVSENIEVIQRGGPFPGT
jgi:polyphosphate kinase